MPKLLRLSDAAVIDVAPAAGLEIASDTDLLREPPSLDGVSVVRLDFPKFKDGRAFTQARVLRQRHGFEGEIRVGGHVLPDQASYLRRLGADTIELDDETRLEDFRFSLEVYRYAYQRPSEDAPAFELRGETA